MKKVIFSIAVLFSALTVLAQTSSMQPQGSESSISPKGKVYGEKVDVKTVHPIGDLAKYMGTRPSITSTVSAKVVAVQPDGDRFTVKDNVGRIIAVRFVKTGYKFPQSIVGKTVLIDGVISKQYTSTEGTHESAHQSSVSPNGYQIAARGVQVMN